MNLKQNEAESARAELTPLCVDSMTTCKLSFSFSVKRTKQNWYQPRDGNAKARKSIAASLTLCTIRLRNAVTLTLCTIRLRSAVTLTLCRIRLRSAVTLTLCTIRLRSAVTLTLCAIRLRSAVTLTNNLWGACSVPKMAPNRLCFQNCFVPRCFWCWLLFSNI